MKKLLFITLMMLGVGSLHAQNNQGGSDIDLQVGNVDPTENNGESTRGPIQPPSVSLDDYTIYIGAHPDYTLTLLDEDGYVIYQTIVPAGVGVVVLPAMLTGEFELRLDFGGSYYFYGYITL